MKQKTLLKLATASASLAAPFMMCAGTYAADPQITINDGTENLYVASGTQNSADGTASYDAASNALTLNNFNGDDITVSGIDSLAIILENNNSISMGTKNSYNIPVGISAPGVGLTFGGTGSLNIEPVNMSNLAASAAAVYADSITIDSASIEIEAPVKACLSSLNNWATSTINGSITINSGDLKLSCNTAMQAKDITLNNGHVEVENKLSSLTTMSKNLTVNGGELTVNASSVNLGSPMTFYGSVEINGGSTVINGGQYGIDFTNLSGTLGSTGHFAVTGGTLDISGSDIGIHFDDASSSSYMEFTGGTTTIDSKYRVAEIIYANENNKNIVLGSGMFLSPSNLTVAIEHKDYSGVYQEYIYYLASDNKAVTSAIISDVVIPDQDEDEIIIPDTASVSKTEDASKNTKAPDTGAITDNQSYIVAAAITLPALFGIGLGLRYFIRSRKTIKLDY